MTSTDAAVSLSSAHSFNKENALSIRLLAGLGVEGDMHAGDAIRVQLPPLPHRALAPV